MEAGECIQRSAFRKRDLRVEASCSYLYPKGLRSSNDEKSIAAGRILATTPKRLRMKCYVSGLAGDNESKHQPIVLPILCLRIQ